MQKNRLALTFYVGTYCPQNKFSSTTVLSEDEKGSVQSSRLNAKQKIKSATIEAIKLAKKSL